MKKIVLGLSGGVDSAVAARLLQNAGYEVSGLYLDIGAPSGAADARAAAEQLGVSLRVLNVAAALEERVCRPFAAAYLRGETPNPCILCNPALKFKALLDYADEVGAAEIATGHYARTENGCLYKGLPANDQSYMLCRLTREQVGRLVLPLGGLEKTQTRALAERFGIPAAHKPDSMEICFIPDKNYAGWLAGRGSVPGTGDIVFDGAVIGRHEGIHRWTVGQRIPGVYDGEKLYVGEICPERGEIRAVRGASLFKTEFFARDFNWLTELPDGPVQGSVKVRHTKTDCPDCTAYPMPDGGVRFVCSSPVRAPARGQSAVLYAGERVLGGGFII